MSNEPNAIDCAVMSPVFPCWIFGKRSHENSERWRICGPVGLDGIKATHWAKIGDSIVREPSIPPTPPPASVPSIPPPVICDGCGFLVIACSCNKPPASVPSGEGVAQPSEAAMAAAKEIYEVTGLRKLFPGVKETAVGLISLSILRHFPAEIVRHLSASLAAAQEENEKLNKELRRLSAQV